MEKSPEAFRTISEVADWLGVPTHVLRFWESRFSQVKPVKRAGGRRYYRPSDMALIGGIKRLLHDDGMTIRGVQKLLREQGVRHVAGLSQPLFDAEEEAVGEVIDMPPLRPEEDPAAAPVEDVAVEPAPPADPVEPREEVAVTEPVADVEEAMAAAPEEGQGLLDLMGAPPEPAMPEDQAVTEAAAPPPPAEPADAPALPEETSADPEPEAEPPLETVPEPVPAPPIIPETPDVPETDLPDDAAEIDDTPALAARLALLSAARLAGHGPALRAAHDRLAALRERTGS